MSQAKSATKCYGFKTPGFTGKSNRPTSLLSKSYFRSNFVTG